MRYTVNREIFTVDEFLANLPCPAFAKKCFLKTHQQLENFLKKFCLRLVLSPYYMPLVHVFLIGYPLND